jgi:crossover junction endodeoxyribonuclease RuvC
MTAGVRVLGIDASLRSTGLAVVEARGTALSLVSVSTLRQPAAAPRSACLAAIQKGILELIASAAPGEAAIEGGFFHRNARTADILGQVRGAAIAACAGAGVPVFEYPPRRVKQAVAGSGGAEKLQVRRMVMQLLGLRDEPQEDAGDALAIAICRLHGRSRHAALSNAPI